MTDKTRLFIGAKMDGDYQENREKINEINGQLNHFFSQINDLEKDGEYKIYALNLIS